MSSPTTTSAQAERSEIKQVYATVYDLGCPVTKESIEIYEVVRCSQCDTGACTEEADLHEKVLPLAGLYMPCPIHGGCGALLTTDREPVRVYHFDAASFQADEDGHRHADAYPLYSTHRPQPLAEFREHAAPFKSSLMTTKDVITLAGTEMDWLWEKYISPGTITFLFSDGGVGKTTFVLSLLHHILQGQEFVGRPTQRAKIIYASEEPAKLLTSKLVRQTGSALLDSPFIHWFLKGETKIFKPGAEGAPQFQPHNWDTISGVIRDEIQKHHRGHDAARPVLVVLDTLMGVVTPKDLIDPAKVGETMNSLRMLTTTTGAALLILHHTEKTGRHYLGGVGLKDHCDFMFELAYKTVKTGKKSYSADKKSSLRLLKNEKQRDEGSLLEDLWIELDVAGGTGYHLPEKPPPLPGERAAAAESTGGDEEPVDLSNPLGLSSLQQRLLPLYQAGEHSPTKLGKTLGCDKSNASRAISELKKKEIIE